MGVCKFGQIWARMGKSKQVWIGQSGRIGNMNSDWEWECVQVWGWVWVCLGRYGQGWSKVGRSGLVREIGWGWVTWIVGGCGYVCRSRGECEWVWASLGKYGQGWAGLDGSD